MSIWAALALSLAASPLGAQTLTLGTKLELNTLDPHFFAAFPTGSSHELIYEKLTALDEKLVPRPQLAVSWKNLDNLTWEIKLRKGVVFHNGAPFTADDVIFTWERVPNVPNSPNSFSQFTRNVEKITKLDDHTIQMKTLTPTPMLPNDLANVFIISASAAKGMTTQDFNAGKAAIGTGPYQLVEWKNGEQLVVERFEKYWGAKPVWAKVTERVIAKDPTRLAALLSGQVDAIGCSTTVAAQIAKRAGDANENKLVLRQQFMAVAMRQGQTDLEKTINEFVARNTTNGELSKLYVKWLQSELPTLPAN
jgi:peptide/nickel transport system substrate-binding protein